LIWINEGFEVAEHNGIQLERDERDSNCKSTPAGRVVGQRRTNGVSWLT